jgi:dTDP-4-amino-4,6-dideoxy-D-galactose acyltransferase
MIEYLQWDSDFFCKKIYKASIDTHHQTTSYYDVIISELIEAGAEGAYLILDTEDKLWEAKLRSKGLVCIDNKVMFTKILNADDSYSSCKEIERYSGELNTDLVCLAYEAGMFSRFKLDKKLNPKFEDMYYIWIKNSVAGLLADLLLVYKSAGKIEGMITGKIHNGKAVIGLVAASKTFQGKGVGTKLILAAESAWLKCGIQKIEVATQKANIEAMKFYIRRGYQIKAITPIYHIWFKKNDYTI